MTTPWSDAASEPCWTMPRAGCRRCTVAAAARLGALTAVLLDWAADDAGQSCANGPPPRWTGYARTAEHDAHVTDHRPA